jgi:hypothetical protein
MAQGRPRVSACAIMRESGAYPAGRRSPCRDARKKRDIKKALMRRSVRRRKACPVDQQRDGQALQRHVVENLVVGTLQKGRVERHKRAHSPCRPCRTPWWTACDSAMPTSYARREFLRKRRYARALRHRGGHGAYAPVRLCNAQRVSPTTPAQDAPAGAALLRADTL